MPKRHKRKHKAKSADYVMPITEEELTMSDEKLPEQTPSNPPPLAHDRPAPDPVTLQDLRERALRMRKDATDSIASLESWRDEIDATIAFLKASKR